MKWKIPKNTSKYYWTQHVVEKMHYYGLSEQKVLGVIKKPFRTETGIAPETVAVMVPIGNMKKPASAKASAWQRKNFTNDEDGELSWSQEIWVMYQLRQNVEENSKLQIITSKKIPNIKSPNIQKLEKLMKLKARKLYIISAWRFPGVSPEKDPIPAEIWREIEEMNMI